MLRVVHPVVLVALVLAIAVRQAHSLRQDAALAGLDSQVETAVVNGDTAALDTLYADDLRFSHFTGTVDGKPGRLRQARSRAFRQRRVDSVAVDRHGDVALTSGRIAVESSTGERYRLRYVRVYAYRLGRWQLIAHRSVGVDRERPMETR
jgi:hypothetical protein